MPRRQWAFSRHLINEEASKGTGYIPAGVRWGLFASNSQTRISEPAWAMLIFLRTTKLGPAPGRDCTFPSDPQAWPGA